MIPSPEIGGRDGFGIAPVWRPAARKRGADLLARLVAHGARAASGCDGSAGTGPGRSHHPVPAQSVRDARGDARRRPAGAPRPPAPGGDVLAVQDTTMTRASGRRRGSFLHATIAVDAASGAVLGALDAQFLERTEGGRASRLAAVLRGPPERPLGRRHGSGPGRRGGRRGSRWWRTARRTCSSSSPVARPMSTSWCAPCTTARSPRGGKLAAAIARGPRLGHAALDLPARPGVPARTARLAIRFGRLRPRTAEGAPPDLLPSRSRWPMSTSARRPRPIPGRRGRRRAAGALAASHHARRRHGRGRARRRRGLREALEERGALPHDEAQGLRHRGACGSARKPRATA